MAKSIRHLKSKWNALKRKQEEIHLAIKKTQIDLQKERLLSLEKILQKTEFPMHKTSLLIGAILSAKEKINAGDIETINTYIEHYIAFSKEHPVICNLLEEEESNLSPVETERSIKAEQNAIEEELISHATG